MEAIRTANPIQPHHAAASGDRPSEPKLLDCLTQALRSRHYSRRTEQTYRHWVKRFIIFPL
jgi:hypothetical protein